MKIVIAGGTGFLGRPLTARLVSEGHEVVILTRGAAAPDPGHSQPRRRDRTRLQTSSRVGQRVGRGVLRAAR
jgi:nucleoside-diphosphate-sugar epimerase